MTRDKMLGKTSRIVGLCSIANFINAADRVIMPIAIVPMTDQFKWSLHWQGWILSAFAFGYFTSQVIGACAANRFGGKTVLFFAVFLWSVSTSVTPLLATSIPALIFCRVLLGLGEGLGLPTIFHIFAHSVPIEERSRAFGYLVAAGSVGQTVASILCPHLAWQTSFYLFGTLGIVWVFIWLVFHNENTTLAKDEIPLFVPKVTNTNVRWTEFVCHWPLWAVYVAHFAMNWSNYIIMQWLPTYLSRNLGANKESISLTAVPYIVNSLVGIVAGHFADTLVSRRWSVLSVRRLMTSVGLIGPGVFLLAFCAVDNLLFAVVFIIHNDHNNPLVSSLEKFQHALKTFSTDLLVVSGLQMMDNYPFKRGERTERLLGIREQMLSQRPQTKVHFEMASYMETRLLEQLLDLVIPHSDSLGMNEQELTNLVNLYQFGNVSFVSDSFPRVATVLDQMRQLLRLVRDSSALKGGSRVLTRIHVHTLAYQAILTTDPVMWPHSDIAAAKASLTAHRHVCATPQINPDKAQLIMDDSFSLSVGEASERVKMEPQRPVSCWQEGPLHLCVAPVLVCKESVQTAGGGDNISAAALAMQL